MNDLPSGTVSFLFTDIEGSTKRWERQPQAMAAAVARHDSLMRAAIAEHSGYVFKTVGDAFCAAFSTASSALAAALAAQRGLAAEPWGDAGQIRVRMAVHVGVAEERDADYFGPAVNRVARLMSAGHGSQVLLSLSAGELLHDSLPADANLRDLGEHRLKDLARPERIFQLVVPDLPSEFPPLVTLDLRPNNLPVQLTPFVGRERDVAAVGELLKRPDVRLVTLTGPGGMGKTRLSLQVAAELVDDFADGTFFVVLDEVNDPQLVLPQMAQTLGLREAGGQSIASTLAEYVKGKRLLPVLDNLEQVVDAGRDLAALLRAAPLVKMLVSSRVRLGVQGEHEYQVPPLGLPERRQRLPAEELTRYEAVRLFIERAQAAKPDFAVTDENAQAVVEICHALDGLPLAIELAAARIRLLPPRAMLPRLEHRLTLLTGGRGDRPERQQTLRGTIAWSHDLLKPAEQLLFARLSVFAGGCTLEAAEAVVNPGGDLDLLEGIEVVVDHSLLRQVAQVGPDGEPRFAMLATIREFARERLEAVGGGEDVLTGMLHAEYYLNLVERAESELTGPEQALWLDRLEADHDNLRAALEWLEESDEIEQALRLAGALRRFWYVRGYLTEGRDRLERGLQRAEEAPIAVQAKAFDAAGALAWSQGDYLRASELIEYALALYDELRDTAGMARSLVQLGLVATDQGHYELAERYYEDGLSHYRELGDIRGESVQLNNLGRLAFLREDFGRAAEYYAESLSVSRRVGDPQVSAVALVNLAEAHEHQGEWEGVAALYDEALLLLRRLGDKQRAASALAGLGRVARLRGDLQQAGDRLREGLALFDETGDYAGVAMCLESIGSLLADRGDTMLAARVFGTAAGLRAALGVPLAAAYLAEYDRQLAAVRSRLGEVAWAAAWESAQALPRDQAIAEAARFTHDGTVAKEPERFLVDVSSRGTNGVAPE